MAMAQVGVGMSHSPSALRSSVATTAWYDTANPTPRSSYGQGSRTASAHLQDPFEGLKTEASDRATAYLNRDSDRSYFSQTGNIAAESPDFRDKKIATRNQRVRNLYHKRLKRRQFLHWKGVTSTSQYHDVHLDVRLQIVWLAQKSRNLKRMVFKHWRILNGNLAQFNGVLAMISNRNHLKKRQAFGIWNRHVLEQRDKAVVASHTHRNRTRARYFFWWKYVVEQSNFHGSCLNIRLRMFVALYQRWLKKRALQEWARKTCHQDLTKLSLAIEHCSMSLLHRTFTAWRDYTELNKQILVNLRGAILYQEHLCKWKCFQAWYSYWQEASARRLIRLMRLALEHLRWFTMLRAFATWKSCTEASLQISRLVTLSAVRSRLHHHFAAWCGYVFGYQEGLGIQPGGCSIEEEMQARESTLAIRTMQAASTGRRRRALIANFKSARVWELMVQAFRGWAGMAASTYVPPDDGTPNADTWYPMVRLVRLVHIEWATIAGEEAWHEGLRNAQRIWRSFQVWKMFLLQQRLHWQRTLLVAARWYSSRLAWRSFQAWVQVVLAARVANNIHEQARLWMFLAFQRWRNTACVSHSKTARAERMRLRGLKRTKTAFFNTWKQTTERSKIGRQMQLLLGEVEASARAAREENEAMRRSYENMLHQTAASEEEARQEREVAKRLCAEQMNTAELYHELLRKAEAEAELQRRRGEAAELEARNAQDSASRLASAVEEETESYNLLVTNLSRLREESSSGRAALSPPTRSVCSPGGLCCRSPCTVAEGHPYRSPSPCPSSEGIAPTTPGLAAPPPLSLSPSSVHQGSSRRVSGSLREQYAAAGGPPPRRRSPSRMSPVSSPPRELLQPPQRLPHASRPAAYSSDSCSELASMLRPAAPGGPAGSPRTSRPESQVQPAYLGADLITEHEVDLWAANPPALPMTLRWMGA